MADAKNDVAKNWPDSKDFVTNALGRWSSHPEMLAWQHRVFRLIAFLPIVFWLVIAVVFIANYKEFEFSKVHDLATLGHSLGLLLARCGWVLVMLFCALCATWGFSVTANMLWGASRKISLASPSENANRDALPFPISVIAAIALFWLVPVVLPVFKGLLTAIDVRLYWMLLILSNICCFLPFVILRIWMVSVGAGVKDKGNLRHPYTHLCLWILYIALASIVISIPDIPPVTQFADGPFADFVNNHFPWVLKVLDVTVPVLFHWCRILLALYLGWKCLVHFLKWRLIWVPAKDSRQNGSKDAADPGSAADEGETDASKAVRDFVADLPDGITLEGEVAPAGPEQSSPAIGTGDSICLDFLMDIPDGASPTKDQRYFFDRFVSSYEEARNGFLENEDPRAPQRQADLILHGPDGSGRTSILLASALYAAVVRGQHVLYVVQSQRIAERFAERINARLRALMVDSYFSSGTLKPSDAFSWIESYARRVGEESKADADGKEKAAQVVKIPPNILFATPEMIERCFFSSAVTLDMEQRGAMRRMLSQFGMFVIDDYLEYPVPVRAHIAFIVDKFRLILATEFVVPQFLVATPPLDAQNSIDMLGQRLFGFNRFNRRQNVYEISPRSVPQFLRGTLVVKRGMPMATAIRNLLVESLEKKGLRTLLYYRGICAYERTKLDEEFKSYVCEDKLKVIGSLDELTDRPTCDCAFFVSSDDKADLSLRLNMADDAAPSFLRIKMEGEVDSVERSVALIPDETAVALRAFHLRSVLQYVPSLTPVEAGIWGCFGVFGDHPNIKYVKAVDDTGSHVAVQWYQDDMPPDDRYVEGQIWAYLVLATRAAISTRGQLIDFTVLPVGDERIWVDEESTGLAANRLLLMRRDGRDDDESVPRQMVSWRDTKNVRIGESDLAHSEELIYVRRGCEMSDDEIYTIGGIPPQEDLAKDPGRFAFAVTARYRRGTEEEYVCPVRRFSWDVPTRNMEIVDLSRLNGLAQFMIRLKDDLFYRVDGFLGGLLNLRGQEQDFYPPKEFAYDAYMSCIVLEPTFKRLKASSSPEDYVRECMRGKWTTSMRLGFSPALTHALAAAFRRRFSGWSFFALAPVFYIEGREGSIGKAAMWIVEPANSGRTVWPVLKALFEESAFWMEICADACDILGKCTELWQLRMCSKLAFADERLEKEDVDKALEILRSIQGKRTAGESATDQDADGDSDAGNQGGQDGVGDKGDGSAEEKDDGDEAKGDETKGDEAKGDEAKPRETRRTVATFTKEEREFENVVLDALNRFEDTIDVTDTAFVRANFTKPEIVAELFNDILWNHPEIFYISKSHRYYREWLSDGTIKSFIIQDVSYGITKDQFAEAKAELDDAVKDAMEYLGGKMAGTESGKILESLRGQPNISGIADKQVVEALADAARHLHDYIVKVCEYDVEACDTNDSSPAARTAYSVLVRHLAVCEGYAMAYRYLLNEIGITSEEVISEAMTHCWNYVQLGGNWYHVDVTWDDPVYQGRKPKGGRISHENFLLSDAAIRMRPRDGKEKHHSWNVRGLPAAVDTRFDLRKWDVGEGQGGRGESRIRK